MNRGHRLLYRIGDADVDPAQACIRKPDQPDQYLRPKALQVLLYLLEHRDRAVTKDELLAHAWAGLAVSDDVLVGCVGEIRRALGDGPRGTQFIRTLPKVGYRFVATANEIRLEPDEQQPEVPSVVAGPPEPVPAPPRFSWHGMLFVALPTLAATFFILYLTRHPLPGRITS